MTCFEAILKSSSFTEVVIFINVQTTFLSLLNIALDRFTLQKSTSCALDCHGYYRWIFFMLLFENILANFFGILYLSFLHFKFLYICTIWFLYIYTICVSAFSFTALSKLVFASCNHIVCFLKTIWDIFWLLIIDIRFLLMLYLFREKYKSLKSKYWSKTFVKRLTQYVLY